MVLLVPAGTCTATSPRTSSVRERRVSIPDDMCDLILYARGEKHPAAALSQIYFMFHIVIAFIACSHSDAHAQLRLTLHLLGEPSSGTLTAGVDRVTGHRSECSLREARGKAADSSQTINTGCYSSCNHTTVHYGILGLIYGACKRPT